MTWKQWEFTPYDTLFFRDSRPKDASGAGEQDSRFPPTARTLAGVVRTAMGQHVGVDWAAFGRGDGTAHSLAGCDLCDEIGGATSLGRLRLGGLYLLRGEDVLYPLPAMVLAGQTPPPHLVRLRPGAPCLCDLGKVALPVPETSEAGLRSLEDVWITESGLSVLLSGDTPDYEEVVFLEDLVDAESRVGLALDSQTRTGIEGQLYQARQLRLRPGVRLAVDVGGVFEGLQPSRGQARFGGKGRMAHFATRVRPTPLQVAPSASAPQGLVLCLRSPADLDGASLPAGFTASDEGGLRVWRGRLNDVPLIIDCAVVARHLREGGWDLVNRLPRPARSLLPAGSCWFCRTEGESVQDAVAALGEVRIGNDTEMGLGHCLIGYW